MPLPDQPDYPLLAGYFWRAASICLKLKYFISEVNGLAKPQRNVSLFLDTGLPKEAVGYQKFVVLLGIHRAFPGAVQE